MSQSRRSNPKYRHYQPKDLGVVRIDGKDPTSDGTIRRKPEPLCGGPPP